MEGERFCKRLPTVGKNLLFEDEEKACAEKSEEKYGLLSVSPPSYLHVLKRLSKDFSESVHAVAMLSFCSWKSGNVFCACAAVKQARYNAMQVSVAFFFIQNMPQKYKKQTIIVF